METISCPALLVSAPASGQGKTLTTAALARAWRNRGFKVRAFKSGPDFLDPMVLEKATGQPVFNLDLDMCGEQDCLAKLYQAAQEADVIIVEGVMGLHDGSPSSADIAARFAIPVLVTIDASAMAQTFAAVALGLFSYRPEIKVAGVIANKIGGPGHVQMLRNCLPNNIPWQGALPMDETYTFPERHLGLFRASEIDNLDDRIEAAARALGSSSELPLPPVVTFNKPIGSQIPPLLSGKTIAIARDEAFYFIYPANLSCLQALGASLKFFSPLYDKTLPEADAYWLPGGYPELHTKAIAENTTMHKALQTAFSKQKPILAECGGMMALSQSIDNQSAFGLLPGESHMQIKLQGLGTQHLELEQGKLSAHTFHYGRLDTSLSPTGIAETRFGNGEAYYKHGSIKASFMHFYFSSNPSATAGLFLP